jgi:CDP-diacylglycerol--serine O-phosphatidyltransferase
VTGLCDHQLYFEGMEWCIVAGILVSSYLLVCELPMFALKFKTWGWKGNEIKYVFLLTCIPLLFLGYFGLAAIIAWYVVLSAVNSWRSR